MHFACLENAFFAILSPQTHEPGTTRNYLGLPCAIASGTAASAFWARSRRLHREPAACGITCPHQTIMGVFSTVALLRLSHFLWNRAAGIHANCFFPFSFPHTQTSLFVRHHRLMGGGSPGSRVPVKTNPFSRTVLYLLLRAGAIFISFFPFMAH